MTLPYENATEFERISPKMGIMIINKSYTEKVTFIIEISKTNHQKNIKKIQKDYFQKMEIKIEKEKYINIQQNPFKYAKI